MGSPSASATEPLAGRCVLVVGASSGIGAACVHELASRGALVAAVARRAERLATLAEDRPDRILALPGNVRNPGEPEAWVEAAIERFGGLDAIVYVAGLARYAPLAEADFEDWSAALETNLIGAAMVTRAAIDALTRTRGRAVYVSSISALDHPPRSGLGLYMTSKIALDKMITVWDREHPEIDFTRVAVGDTGGTEFGAGWDREVVARAFEAWTAQGYSFGRMQEPEAVARHIADVLLAEESIPFTCIQPRRTST